MENASDALIMAGQILIFIIALTVCISSFTTLRAGIDQTVGQTETIEMARDSQGYINFLESKNSKSTRVVGAETIVSSMYRSIKENYVIYIKFNNATDLVGEIHWDNNGKTEKINITKAKYDIYSDGTTQVISKGDDLVKITIGAGDNQKVNSMLKNGLYEKIKKMRFNEYLGEYQNNSEASTENKETYRIITYVQTNDT